MDISWISCYLEQIKLVYLLTKCPYPSPNNCTHSATNLSFDVHVHSNIFYKGHLY